LLRNQGEFSGIKFSKRVREIDNPEPASGWSFLSVIR
jgi:hypothetical protein